MKTEEVQTEKLDKALQSFIWKISDENFNHLLEIKIHLGREMMRAACYSSLS